MKHKVRLFLPTAGQLARMRRRASERAKQFCRPPRDTPRPKTPPETATRGPVAILKKTLGPNAAFDRTEF